jgi:hypothetical protein
MSANKVVAGVRCSTLLRARVIAMHVATPSAAERQLWLPVIVAMALGAVATLLNR